MTYEHLDVTEFGRLLFSSADLDPVYKSLIDIPSLDDARLNRFLIGYWAFYHCGVASFISEQEGNAFWRVMLKAAENITEPPCGGRWPRGAERRHFRGKASVDAVVALRNRYGNKPEGMVDYLASGPMDVRSVIARATTHKLFGPWIGFKIADMLDAVVGYDVDQDDVSAFLYDTPRQSILEKLPTLPIKKEGSEQQKLERAMLWLQRELSHCRIPHKPRQKPDLFSLETVWCKHLSHMHDHYPLYNDINEIRSGLKPWEVVSETAQNFLKHMPPAPKPQFEQEGLFKWVSISR